MSNRLDQLFKEKLAGHVTPPSSRAWERVGSALAKKNSQPVWWRVAAALLLLGSLTFVVIWLTSDTKKEVPAALSKKTELKTAPKKEATESQLVVDEKVKVQRLAKAKKQAPIIKQQKIQPAVIEDHHASIQITPEPEHEEAVAIAELPKEAAPKVEKGIVLEYRLTPVAAAETPATTAQTAKTKSGFTRVIEFALDAKNGDSHLGDLRQAKDELFALNFKKDKQNNQK